jgi:hypothetical protein
MDEPLPIRRAVIGCLALALLGIAVTLLVRPTILLFADPRDDSNVVIGTSVLTDRGPVALGVVLSRSYGWDGEAGDGSGRVDLAVIAAPGRFGGVTTVAAASPVDEDCPLTIGGDRLTDCEDRAWSFEGFALDPADPPLDRFPTTVDDGNVVVDFTRTLDE